MSVSKMRSSKYRTASLLALRRLLPVNALTWPCRQGGRSRRSVGEKRPRRVQRYEPRSPSRLLFLVSIRHDGEPAGDHAGESKVGTPGGRTQRLELVARRPVQAEVVVPRNAYQRPAPPPRDRLGVRDVAQAAPAHAVDHGDGPGPQLLITMAVQPFERHLYGAGGVGARRGDEHQLVGVRKHPRDDGGGGVEHRDRIEVVERTERQRVVAIVQRLHRVLAGGDDIEPRLRLRRVPAHRRQAGDLIGTRDQAGQRLRRLTAGTPRQRAWPGIDIDGDYGLPAMLRERV